MFWKKKNVGIQNDILFVSLVSDIIYFRRSLQAQLDAKKKETSSAYDSKLKKSFPVSIQALKVSETMNDRIIKDMKKLSLLKTFKH